MTKLHSEFIPALEKSSRRLMIMLHGLGDSLEGYRWWPEAMALPQLNYLLVNAPDGYYGGFSWFDIGNELPGVERSRRLLVALLDEWRAKGFPAEQTTLGGFSQGCVMTIDVGLRYPQRLAGLVGISGWVFGLDEVLHGLSPAARQQRLLMTHGTDDPMVAIARVRPQIPRLETAGLNVEWKEFSKVHTIHGEIEMAVIREFVRAGYPAGDGQPAHG